MWSDCCEEVWDLIRARGKYYVLHWRRWTAPTMMSDEIDQNPGQAIQIRKMIKLEWRRIHEKERLLTAIGRFWSWNHSRSRAWFSPADRSRSPCSDMSPVPSSIDPSSSWSRSNRACHRSISAIPLLDECPAHDFVRWKGDPRRICVEMWSEMRDTRLPRGCIRIYSICITSIL